MKYLNTFLIVLFLTGCTALEAQWEKAITPDMRERATNKGQELREEYDAMVDTVEPELKAEAKRLVLEEILAP